MSFLPAARNVVATRPANDPLRITFEFLFNQHPPAIGPAHSVSITTIINHLAGHGIAQTYNGFQQGLLNQTRGSQDPIFIGSGAGGCYLIDTIDHARAALHFYQVKIDKMVHNRDNLIRQAHSVGWQL